MPDPPTPLTPRTVIEAARRLARLSRDEMLPELDRSYRLLVSLGLLPADKAKEGHTNDQNNRMDLVMDCYLTGAAEMLKMLHGNMDAEPWSQYDHETRLTGLFATYAVGPLPSTSTGYCTCWAAGYQPGVPMYYEHWYGVVRSWVTGYPPGFTTTDAPYIEAAYAAANLVQCHACGRIAPWRGEPVGQCTLDAALAAIKRFYQPDGCRRQEPLHA